MTFGKMVRRMGVSFENIRLSDGRKASGIRKRGKVSIWYNSSIDFNRRD